MFEHLKFDRSTVPNRIVEEIKALIQEQKLRPGEKLPSERDLSLTFNVSRNTIRESYKILSTLGFIEIKHGHGAFVADEGKNLANLTDQYFIRSDQLADLFEIRRLIETSAVIWSVERASDNQMDELYQFVKETVLLLNEKKVNDRILSERDHTFHTKIAELSHNAIAFRIMNSLTGLFNKVRQETSKIPDRIHDSWQEHIQIVEMMKKRDSVKAKEYMEKHLQSVEQTLKEELKGGKL
ncbi:FadR/GntR family transcriptional regulator [uncultured Metabacillus sp.]|uniref:FadR/GntR family transcriptional regulator n=1 Tax=uncultured Metabacillus sp. TaxID=2860135 RepID=UPI0026267472|nr:FadR/GntR family transcriptional regulator [uncultured Metabacillus sp.]